MREGPAVSQKYTVGFPVGNDQENNFSLIFCFVLFSSRLLAGFPSLVPKHHELRESASWHLSCGFLDDT